MRHEQSGMTILVKTITRLTAGLIFIYGVFIAKQGHSAAGGGFDGGVIIALSLILIVLAFGKKTGVRCLGAGRALVLAAAGAAALWLSLYTRHEIAAEFSAAVMVATGLFAIYLTLMTVAGERAKQ